MKTIMTKLIVLSAFSMAFSQGTWVWTGRVHSELKWHQIPTEHFNIFYHTEIEDIAKKGAGICEQAYPVLREQMGLEKMPVIDVIFTSEDEIMNGYALWTNQTFIWVDQNDAAIWLEDEKWLTQVLTHELQHIFFFNTIKTWMPEPFSFAFAGVPGWVVEGLAEYYTEKWRPFRADLSHKYHVYKNKTSKMDPHHDGYSKCLLLADKFGDSTIVNILHHRNKMGMFDFRKAFKKYTHMSVTQFNEEWRQVMNTYYYGYRAQKESIEDIGVTATLPVKQVGSFLFSPDSLHIAVIGQDSDDQLDNSLLIVEMDTTRHKVKPCKLSKWISKSDKKEDQSGEKKRHKPEFQKKEIDYGQLHPAMSWSQDGQKLLYAKYRYGSHGSMLYDIRLYDSESGKQKWLTSDRRASYPIWDESGDNIMYVAHKNGNSNLFRLNLLTKEESPVTRFLGDTQILYPQLSPDGMQIAFAVAYPGGNCDIDILDISSSVIRTITSNPEADYIPIWHPDGKKITFTSHKGSTPNLHTIDLISGEDSRSTDVAEAVWGVQWSPKGNTILAKSLNTADSVRVSQIDPSRTVTTSSLNIRDSYLSWRTKRPDVPISGIDPSKIPDTGIPRDYRFYHHFKHMTSFVLPVDVLLGGTVWTDALGKHILQLMGGTTWDGDYPFVLAEYINAQHGPLWGVNYFYNVNWSFRFYDGSSSGLFEKYDGINFWVSHPINFGNSMASNHMITAAIAMHQRRVVDVTDDNNISHIFTGLPAPEEGREGILTVNYQWVNRRPDKRNIALPRQGWGLNLNAKVTSANWVGDFTYQRYTADSFTNLSAGPGTLFFRLKGELLNGNAPDQDYIGFSDDITIYGAGNLGTFGLPENINPRGWDGYLLGDKMIFGSAEYRIPIFPSLPIEVFGIKLGQITAAAISDFGNVWGQSDAPSIDWITTAGYEMKFGIQFGGAPILFIGVGSAQLVEDWKNDEKPGSYVRFSLINPF